jgi:hypothetical protein
MSAPVYSWIVVFENGTSETCSGETPSAFIDDIDWSDQCSIIAIVRNGYYCGG